MNVLIVSHLWPRGGFAFRGIFVLEQAAALERQCGISVCTPVDLNFRALELTSGQLLSGFPKYRARTRPELSSLNGELPRVVTYTPPLFRKVFADTTARRLAKALTSLDLTGVDIVHAHTLFPDGLACAYWLEEKPIKLVVTIHGADLYRMGDSRLKALRPLFQRANRFIPVSGALARQLEDAGAPAEKIKMVSNGFSVGLFENAPYNSPRPRKIVYLGRLDPVKRVDLLIRALPFCPPDTTLEIGGIGRTMSTLKSLAARMGLSHRVTLHGALSRDRIPEFLSSAALMCLVSLEEGWPTVIFEAFACGTPILATTIGGMPEAISSPDLGVLVPPKITPQELGKAITVALEESWDHQLIRDRALNQSWDTVADKIFDIYQQVTGTLQPASAGGR